MEVARGMISRALRNERMLTADEKGGGEGEGVEIKEKGREDEGR